MARKKLLFINPIGFSQWDEMLKQYIADGVDEETEVDVVSLKRGPYHLEYHYYEALIAADMLHTIKQAEKDGYDAAIIGCFYDPFLREAREICEHMVVTAPAESALQLAATLGDTFSIIVGRKKWIPVMKDNVRKYGFIEKLASFRSLEMGVLDFHQDENRTREMLITEAQKAVTEDRAESLILGCTIQFGFYKELQEIIGAPVIDVVLAPVKHAEMLVDIRNRFGWKPSKVGVYETPSAEEIKEFGLEEQYGIKGLW